ncbi:MAG: SpoIIIAH-like family protein [Clostridia bacterium]|nr:SpoIIIAH-like family protein [Clostridia bacterium]
MKRYYRKAAAMALTLCAVLSAFYLRAAGDRRQMTVPVQRVFAVVSTPSPAVSGAASWKAERALQREEEIDALQTLASTDARAAEELRALVARSEGELAVEQALAALGYADPFCALRDNAVSVCLSGMITAEEAQKIMEICERLTGVPAENVFILDACGNL